MNFVPSICFFRNITDTASINKDLAIIKAAYHYRDADGKLTILTGQSDEERFDFLKQWINRK